jgi:hypothetical protein
MNAQVGDRVVVEAERITQAPRHGAIEEILQEQPPRFRDSDHSRVARGGLT